MSYNYFAGFGNYVPIVGEQGGRGRSPVRRRAQSSEPEGRVCISIAIQRQSKINPRNLFRGMANFPRYTHVGISGPTKAVIQNQSMKFKILKAQQMSAPKVHFLTTTVKIRVEIRIPIVERWFRVALTYNNSTHFVSDYV